jgi:hypothetical protein
MANRLKSRTILNLVGVTKADKLLDAGTQTLPLERLAQNVAYNIYVTTSRQLHLTHDQESAFGGLTTERGLPLAQAFDQVIRDTAYDNDLTKRPRIDRVSRKRLEELADGLFLDRIPREERDILIDAVIPSKPEDSDERIVMLILRVVQPSRPAIVWATHECTEQPTVDGPLLAQLLAKLRVGEDLWRP